MIFEYSFKLKKTLLYKLKHYNQVLNEFPLRRIVRKNPTTIPNRNNFLLVDFTYLADEF
jgi:hypothetical protein